MSDRDGDSGRSDVLAPRGKLIARSVIESYVRRLLARTTETLCKAHGPEHRRHLGEYFIVDHDGCLKRDRVALESLAGELGVIRPDQRIVDG